LKKKLLGLGATLTLASCVCLIAFGQGSVKESAKILAMRKQADKNAMALATVVQARAVATGKYDNNMGLYAKPLGGKYPVNPCTGTPTGYTMTVSGNGKSSVVAAVAGKNCGKWSPNEYHLKLK